MTGPPPTAASGGASAAGASTGSRARCSVQPWASPTHRKAPSTCVHNRASARLPSAGVSDANPTATSVLDGFELGALDLELRLTGLVNQTVRLIEAVLGHLQ